MYDPDGPVATENFNAGSKLFAYVCRIASFLSPCALDMISIPRFESATGPDNLVTTVHHSLVPERFSSRGTGTLLLRLMVLYVLEPASFL